MKTNTLFAGTAALALAVCAQPALASDDAAPQPANAAQAQQDLRSIDGTGDDRLAASAGYGTLTGNWGGVRDDLVADGVTISADYTNEFAANLSGGDRKDATDVGQLALGASLDTDRLIGLKGGTLMVGVTYRHGPQLDGKAGIDTLMQSQEVYGGGEVWRLQQLWYDQKLGGGFDIKLGRLNMSGDFATFACDHQNLTFCGTPIGNLDGEYWHNSPIANWGALLNYANPDWYVKLGVYEDNPKNLTSHAFAISHGGARGVTIPVEAGWTPHLGAAGLPGVWKAGAWYNTGNADDVYEAIDGQPIALTDAPARRHTGRYGAFAMVQQQLTGSWREGAHGQGIVTHGLSLFANFTQSDNGTSTTDNETAAGLTFVGPLAGRPDDDVAIAFGRTHYNTRAARNAALITPDIDLDAEFASELYYSVHLTPWLIVRPNFQYIVHPGGNMDVPDAAIVGIKSSLTI